MTKKKNPFIMVVVTMKEPCGILFLSRPSDDDIMETFADLIRGKTIDEHFKIQRFDITDDVRGAIREEVTF